MIFEESKRITENAVKLQKSKVLGSRIDFLENTFGGETDSVEVTDSCRNRVILEQISCAIFN